ncbi:MAG: hypothetical protein IT320_16410 [Anaerolineae bacterium]|nr:hypothetical protein [Anaerolineae bacterium]
MTLYTIETIHLFQDQLLREAETERLVHEAVLERRERKLRLPLWTSRRATSLDKGLVEIAGEDAAGETQTTTISLN